MQLGDVRASSEHVGGFNAKDTITRPKFNLDDSFDVLLDWEVSVWRISVRLGRAGYTANVAYSQ